MTISARNQMKGTVSSVQEGAVSAIVTLKTPSGEAITATISMEAIKELGLAAGKAVTAIVKATEVMIGVGELQLSARNQLSGEVVSIQEGAVNAIVGVKTDGGEELAATISISAVKELALVPGKRVKAVIKATSVMLAV